MTEFLFDHDRLDVYRLSIEYVASAFETSSGLSGLHRHARVIVAFEAERVPCNQCLCSTADFEI